MAVRESDVKRHASKDHHRLEQKFRADVQALNGRTLTKLRLQIVGDEINLVALHLGDQVLAVVPLDGGELLGLVEWSSRGEATEQRWAPFPSAEPLIGQEISAARVIGEAWNGHGVELSFRRCQDRTLIVQSIYAPSTYDGWDSLRVAVVDYTYSGG